MIRSIRVAAVLGLGFLAAACHGLGDGMVEIRNESQAPATGIVVDVGGLRLLGESLAPGEAKEIWYSAVTDSGLRLHYQRAGQGAMRECIGDVYVTTSGSERLFVTLRPDGTCQVRTQYDPKP